MLKRLKIMVVLLASVVALLGVLLVLLPLSLITSQLPATIQLTNPHGNLAWGQADDLVISGTSLGQITWRVRPWLLWLGEPSWHLSLQTGWGELAADTTWVNGHRFDIDDLSLIGQMNSKWPVALPIQLGANIEARVQQLRIEDNAITSLDGTITLKQLNLGDPPTLLGDYQIATAPDIDGIAVALKSDPAALISTNINVVLKANHEYQLNGLVSSASPALQSLLAFIPNVAYNDGNGHMRFDVHGTY
jgi:Type II secretion system (T2SS), protein N